METLLKKISNDINSMRNEILELREEIDSLKTIKPGYLNKISKLDKNGKFKTFSDINELRKAIENV